MLSISGNKSFLNSFAPLILPSGFENSSNEETENDESQDFHDKMDNPSSLFKAFQPVNNFNNNLPIDIVSRVKNYDDPFIKLPIGLLLECLANQKETIFKDDIPMHVGLKCGKRFVYKCKYNLGMFRKQKADITGKVCRMDYTDDRGVWETHQPSTHLFRV